MNRKPIYLMTAIVGVVGSNSLVLSPIAATVAHSLNAPNTVGVLSAAALYGLGVAAAALGLAPLGDRYGTAKALFAALVILTVALLASMLAATVWQLSAAQAVAGLAAGVAIPSLYVLAAQLAPKGQESKTIGTVLTGWTLSMVGGVTLAAYVADWVSWRAVYGGLAGATALMTLLLFRIKLPKSDILPTHSTPLTALRVPGISRALFSVGALGFGFYGVYNFLGAHLETGLGMDVSASGAVTLLYGLGFAGAMVFDAMLDRVPARRGLTFVFSALALLYLALGYGSAAYLTLLLCIPIWGVLEHLGLNLTVTRLTGLDPTQRGAIMGLNSAVMYLSVFGATLTYSPVFQGHGLVICAVVSAILSLLGLGEALLPRRAKNLAHSG